LAQLLTEKQLWAFYLRAACIKMAPSFINVKSPGWRKLKNPHRRENMAKSGDLQETALTFIKP
jgi:hypothetical protein